ncbi:unnamed protein product [Mytilus coruscus]|uniref:Novel STAND NTPase 3 domain-containing protein n=1 Tax=Mytilus coruscus TaxID=42192 RepID=A0A6J8D1E7_MYTCO|nr:unnamed protein product [Mytilus coruscus]
MEIIQLNLSRRDEIIYEKMQSYDVKLVDEVHNHNIEVNRTMEKERAVLQRKHEEHIYQTELSVRSKIEETMEGVLTNTEQTRRAIQDKIDNLSGHHKDSLTICPVTLEKLDHSNAIINSHGEDQTFVKTCALDEARRILNAQNLLILLAKSGSGKTQIALHLASQYEAEGYIPFLFSDQDITNYRDLISLDEKNIVIVKDLFGRTNVDFSENKHRNVLDILSSFLKREPYISYKNFKDEDVETAPLRLSPPMNDQHDEDNNQDERKFDEKDETENTVGVNSALGLQTDGR